MAPNSKVMIPCTFYQLGKCSKGAGCTYAHVTDPNFRSKPCMAYMKGKCSYGEDCKYSHEQGASNGQQHADTNAIANGSVNNYDRRPQGRQTTEDSNTQQQFRTWRYNIPPNAKLCQPLHNRLANFFQEAQKLAAVDPGVTQEVVTALASDGGLKRIAELAGRQFEVLNDATLVKVFQSQMIPFFSMLSSEHVERSALLEGRVATIYAFLFSPNGARAVSLFSAIKRFLSHIVQHDTSNEDCNASESCLFVMAKIMELNASAAITEPFIPIIQEIAALFEAAEATQQPFTRAAIKSLRKMEQRLHIGSSIPTSSTTKELLDKPVFHVVRDLPGDLSDQGPRHDNDHASIRDIQIMPTLSEISASRSEYLPGFDPDEWHVDGIEGLLDRQFRLVREDTVGQLRDAVQSELDRLQSPIPAIDRNYKRSNGARTFIYKNVRFEDYGFDEFKGLEFAISFDQPFDFRMKSASDRARTWEDTKRLDMDALVCLIDTTGNTTFLMVSHPLAGQNRSAKVLSHRLHKDYTRHKDPFRANAVVRFVEYNADTANRIVSLIDSKNSGVEQMALVEFPGVLVPAFQPTLTALKKMSERLDLPFADLLLQSSTAGTVAVPPPDYVLPQTFSFNLSAVTTQEMHLNVDANGDAGTFDMDAFKASTKLDSGQADALISSLSRSFAITQGPPGTGKSYTGIALAKVLLDNKAKGELGPLLLVSYTNHALDQMLEHLVDAGVTQIVRIGSRSKSEKLTDLNLREVSKKTDSTKTEKSERYSAIQQVREEGQAMLETLEQLWNLGEQKSIEAYLERTNQDHFSQLFNLVDEEGFEVVDYRQSTRLDRWLSGELFPALPHDTPSRNVEQLSMCNLQVTSLRERRKLHRHWTRDLKHELGNRLAYSLETYHSLKHRLELIRADHDLRALSSANIVGVTTSGLARNLNLLRKLKSKVLISEEAGEVQEAHLLTAMLPSIEHVVLIGDHLQLRPQVQNYALSSESKEGRQYCLDVSLFERLVKPLTAISHPLPFSTLDVQRRMHPSIAELVRSTLYSTLQDAPNVNEYPEVAGMRRRLFWLNHEHAEDSAASAQNLQTMSKTNEWEAHMTAALVRHLVRQGAYKPSEIAVLTPYLGQLRKLRDRLRGFYEITLSEGDAVQLGEASAPIEEDEEELLDSDRDKRQDTRNTLHSNVIKGTLMEAVRLSTIDNFQGEEATVVVISLVRCNEGHNPGFLRTENRCNVLLSRAKHGMYIIGNSETAAVAPMWANVIEQLQPDNIGDQLELCCPRHPDKPLLASEPDELFHLAPAGGCQELCSQQMLCGHACPDFCHSDMLHEDVYCLKECTRILACEHPCPNPCGDRCVEKCEVIMEGCEQTLECGHLLTSPTCHQVRHLEEIVCEELVNKTVPGCNHSINVPCTTNVHDEDFDCPAKCAAILPCGHACGRDCASCNTVEDDGTVTASHGSCTSACAKPYANCRHSCSKICHSESGDACPPCKEPCENRCQHAKCAKKCSEPCVPCSEEVCPSNCPHTQACQYPCGAPCDWVPCNRRCTKLLSCGCVCPSVCGEVCPSERFCQTHGNDNVLDQTVDYIEFNDYRDIDLDNEPVVVLDCGHIFTVASLDGVVAMADYYELDDNGLPKAVKRSSNLEFSMSELKSCPDCRGSLRNIARYGRIVRRALLDESTKKFICWSNAGFIPLAHRMMAEQDKLSESALDAKLAHREIHLVGDRNAQMASVRAVEKNGRYRSIFGCRRLLMRFQDQVKLAEQPFQRARDMVEAVRRRKAGDGTTITPFDFDQSLLQTRASLLSSALLLRCDVTILSDVLATRDRTPSVVDKPDDIETDFRINRLDCENLIAQAQQSMQKAQEVEGHVFWARFAALERNVSPTNDGGITINGQQSPRERIRDLALTHLDLAQAICDEHESQTSSVSHEIEPTRVMLRDAVFYTPVSSDEMRAVVAAMASQFRGMGHWYRCVNGHPFTVGECGMPMQTSRCPQCGAPVGGQDHQAAEGVTHARDIEQDFGRLHI